MAGSGESPREDEIVRFHLKHRIGGITLNTYRHFPFEQYMKRIRAPLREVLAAMKVGGTRRVYLAAKDVTSREFLERGRVDPDELILVELQLLKIKEEGSHLHDPRKCGHMWWPCENKFKIQKHPSACASCKKEK